MVNTTPLLLLLDGILSQDEVATNDALRQLREIIPLPSLQESPLRSASSLELIIRACMLHQPQLAEMSSKNDGSLPLHFAASIGNVLVAKLLLEQNRNAACTPNSKGKIPLHYAAREGRLAMVVAMLRMVPETASIQSKKGKLALHFAAGEGHTDVCQVLLKVFPKGASLPSGKGKVPIHFAARWGHMDIAKMLHKVHPSCISCLDYEGSLPLHDAAREGQLEMAQFLIELHPDGPSQENIRGETPLFPAIRSENQDLCDYIIQAWPKGGKHVLQRIRDEDEVESWPENVLDMCLRGAMETLRKEQQQQADALVSNAAKNTKPAASTGATGTVYPHRPTQLATVLSSNNISDVASASSAENDDCNSMKSSESLPAMMSSSHPVAMMSTTPSLDINLPRSKSPVLGVEGGSLKKRSADGSCEACRNIAGSSNKRSRRGSFDVGEHDCQHDHHHHHVEHEPEPETVPKFLQLHSALQCGASLPVVKCVLNRHPTQLQEADDIGKLPLHIAVDVVSSKDQGQKDDWVTFVIDHIWKPYQQACEERDFLGRLPLHLALMSNADCRIIERLLESHPSSGVDICDVVDPRFVDKLPLDIARAYDGSLSTIYLLVRGDPSIINETGFTKSLSRPPTQVSE